MKLNPKKCSFGVEEGLFLGNLSTKQGIKANPSKVKAITNLKPPRTLKEIQSLNGKLAALSRFLSKGVDKSLPFFKALKSCTDKKTIQWTNDAKESFRKMKEFIEVLPTLTAPIKGEVLGVTGGRNKLPRIREAHISPSLHCKETSKAIELGQHDINFQGCNSGKGKILDDFIAKTPSAEDKDMEIKKPEETNKAPKAESTCKLYTNGASSSDGLGSGLMVRKQGYYWRSMYRDAVETIQDCTRCQTYSTATNIWPFSQGNQHRRTPTNGSRRLKVISHSHRTFHQVGRGKTANHTKWKTGREVHMRAYDMQIRSSLDNHFEGQKAVNKRNYELHQKATVSKQTRMGGRFTLNPIGTQDLAKKQPERDSVCLNLWVGGNNSKGYDRHLQKIRVCSTRKGEKKGERRKRGDLNQRVPLSKQALKSVSGLRKEKARRLGKVYNWKTAKYGKIWYDEDVYDLRSVKTEFPAIVFNDKLTSEEALSCEPTVSPLNDNKIEFRISFDESDDEDYIVIYDKNSVSYKIISVNDLKTDSENDNDKVNMPSFPSLEPTVSYFNDLDSFKDFENKFPAIVYYDALTSKLDFLTEPAVSCHMDEFDLKDETSLSEYDVEKQSVLYFNDLFPFNVIYPDDSKSDKDNDDDKIDIKQSLGGNVINTDDGANA
ncbi:hypothetical protein Tco_1185864 [Tanacetum coccineum]